MRSRTDRVSTGGAQTKVNATVVAGHGRGSGGTGRGCHGAKGGAGHRGRGTKEGAGHRVRDAGGGGGHARVPFPFYMYVNLEVDPRKRERDICAPTSFSPGHSGL
jgi:hypothetical protein